MLSARPEGYKGKQIEGGFTDFFIIGNYFGVIDFQDGVSEDDGKILVEKFKEGLSSSSATNLSELESTVSGLILKLNFPVHVGLSVGMSHDDVLYVKSVGDGEVYLRRGNEFNLLISGDKTASGYLKQFDMAIFTTGKIKEIIGKTEDVKAFIEMSSPGEIIRKVSDQNYGDEEKGFICLFVEFQPQKESIVPTIRLDKPATEDKSSAQSQTVNPPVLSSTQPVMPISTPAIQTNLSAPSADISEGNLLQKLGGIFKSKKFTIFIAILIFAILIWSVVFGYQRREAAKLQEKYTSAAKEIDSKLQNSIDESSLNIEKSMVLISEAKSSLDKLKKEMGESRTAEISALEKKIQETENSIVKKETKNYEEFYDLTLENKNAKGDLLSKQGDYIAVLDKGRKAIYLLDLNTKSLTTYASPDVSGATQVALYDKDIYFYSENNGIYKFTTQTKTKDLIAKDEEIKNVADMELYNGNIYLLDAGDDQIYKYLVTEGGFSSKRTYFGEGQTINLTGTVGMSIDSAIYIANSNNVVKYLSGAKESFSPSFPQKDVHFDGIYTDKDLDEVYILDKANSAVYALSKEGEYQKEIQSGIFNKAQAMYVFKKEVHVLVGEKIYSIPLD